MTQEKINESKSDEISFDDYLNIIKKEAEKHYDEPDDYVFGIDGVLYIIEKVSCPKYYIKFKKFGGEVCMPVCESLDEIFNVMKFTHQLFNKKDCDNL